MIEAGITVSKAIIRQIRTILNQAPSIKIEYVNIVDAETLQSIDRIAGKVLVAVAARIGQARLIDNILVDASKQ